MAYDFHTHSTLSDGWLSPVELTHVPPRAIAEAAEAARQAGAWVVVVHGETVAEPVEKGTNLAAIACGQVDILAHPGLITLEEARLAAEREVFLELSAKPDHAVANGHVARIARLAGSPLIANSDNHGLDFLTRERIRRVVLGAGLNEEHLQKIANRNPLRLLERVTKGELGTLVERWLSTSAQRGVAAERRAGVGSSPCRCGTS